MEKTSIDNATVYDDEMYDELCRSIKLKANEKLAKNNLHASYCLLVLAAESSPTWLTGKYTSYTRYVVIWQLLCVC